MIVMIERKSKRASDVENGEEDSEEATFLVEPTHVEVGAGYTVAVSHDEHEREVIDVKTYGQVDMSLLRKEMQRVFPGAEIRRLDQADSVTVIRNSKRKSRNRKK
jgi:hypothetical protein